MDYLIQQGRLVGLTKSYLDIRKSVIDKQCRPRSDATSCGIKRQNRPDILKMANGLVQHITVEEFTSIH